MRPGTRSGVSWNVSISVSASGYNWNREHAVVLGIGGAPCGVLQAFGCTNLGPIFEQGTVGCLAMGVIPKVSLRVLIPIGGP